MRSVKVLVLGATGMLGHRLAMGLMDRGYDVRVGIRGPLGGRCTVLPVFMEPARVIEGVDAYDWRALEKLVRSVAAEVVVNCIGVIKQRSEASAPISCITVNSLLPHVLDQAVSAYGGRLIHFSTDCVFRGDRGQYSETDRPDADDWYGSSKAMGERLGGRAITIRTSIVGPELYGSRSLLGWFLAQVGSEIEGYANAFFSGLSTREMVEVVDLIIDRHPNLSGIHQVASTPVSKYELLASLRDALDLDIRIRRNDTFHIDRTLKPNKFIAATSYQAPSWADMALGIADDVRTYWRNGWLTPPPSHSG